ncbi:hypothetical protein BS78_04G094400 [Paspalum vaginatum]|nr:hypothetical protein BS78_04G094400 [Paspalum vaginatum]
MALALSRCSCSLFAVAVVVVFLVSELDDTCDGSRNGLNIPTAQQSTSIAKVQREALGGLCRHGPVMVFAAVPMGHREDFPTPLWHANSEILLKYYCLASALLVQSHGVVWVFWPLARWLLPCNWGLISLIHVLYA